MLYLDELIHHVVQDIAMDGSLGSAPEYLHELITRIVPTLPSSSTSKPLIDEAFLAYFWRLLIAVPCIQVIVLNSPVDADSSVEPTLVQQPAPPTTGRSRSGAPKKPMGRKRKVPTAKHIAADEAYETAQAAYLAEQDAKRVYVEPLKIIEQDDGSPERLSKLDLPGLQNRYGSRLRIRVDAEERYHALTGAYSHISSMSVLALRCLQVIGRSRSTGVTGQDLAVLLGVDAKSMHHYTKILLQLKLVEKVPVQQNSQRTNRHLLARYAQQNEDYRAWNPSKVQPELAPPNPENDDFEVDSDEEEALRKFKYPPMSSAQLQTGILVKQRLIEVLDSGLQSHCLRNKGVLRLLGYVNEIGSSERRLFRRHLSALINSGIVERLDVITKIDGQTNRVPCLRLTKYNPARQADSATSEVPLPPQEELEEEDEEIEEIERPAFNAMIGVSATLTIEYSVIGAICNASQNLGAPGFTLTELGQALGRLAPRTVEFLITKIEQSESIPHLSDKAVAIVTESEGRQRNLRVVSILDYFRYCEAQRLTVDTERFTPPRPEAGSFGDISHRTVYSSQSEYINHISRRDFIDNGNGVAKPKGKIGRPRKEQSSAPSTQKKPSQALNPHGRPRKYIYFVNEKGKRWRSTMVGDVKMRKGYPACVIFIKSLKRLIIAPNGWTGLGKMPDLTPEVLATARTVKDFLSDPRGDGTGVIGTDDEASEAEVQPERQDDEEEDQEVDQLSQEPPTKKARLADETAPPVSGSSSGKARLSGSPSRPMQVDAVIEVPSSPVPVEPLPPPVETGDSRGRKRKQENQPAVSEPEIPAKRIQRGKRAARAPSAVHLLQHDTAAAAPESPKTPLAANDVAVDQTTTVSAPNAALASQNQRHSQATPAPEEVVPGQVRSPSSQSKRSSVVTPVPPQSGSPKRVGHSISSKASRILVTDTLKKNEILQCLRELGGVSLKHDLRKLHGEWAVRTAGTPGLYYPRTAVTFDRTTYLRVIDNAKASGDVSEETVHVSTATGTDLAADIVILAGTAKEVVEEYKGRLGTGSNFRSVTIVRGPGAKSSNIEQGLFSTAKATRAPVTQKKSREQRLKEKELGLSESDSAIRRTILKERYTVAQLHGFKVGRAARAQVLHEEIARIVSEGAPGVVSSGQGVFTFSCLFQEITLGGFLSVVPVSTYREQLLDFLKTPANREIRLKDLDASVHPQRTSYDQKRMLVVLSMLHELGFISALEGCEPGEAGVIVPRTDASPLHFKLAAEPYHSLLQGSIHFQLLSRVPVYDFRQSNLPLVGIYPAKTPEESKALWTAISQVCSGSKENKLMDLPATDFFPLVWPGLEDTVKALLSEKSWFSTFKINDSQRAVLNNAIDWSTATRKITTLPEINALCYKALLPPQIAADYLVKMEFAAKSKLRRHAERDPPLRRMVQAQASAHGKLGARNAERAQLWDKMFAQVAEELGLQWNEDLKASLKDHFNEYLSGKDKKLPVVEVENVLREKMSGLPTQRRIKGKAGDERQPATGGQGTASGILPSKATLPPLLPSEIVDLRKPEPKTKDDTSKHTRHRHNWPEEDVELLLDAEAIIRSRGRNIPGGQRGHAAMGQIFVGWRIPSLHTVLQRIRRETPATNEYYDRLENAWHGIYMSNRGTASLPDPHPNSMTDFDLLYHINFLRKNVNKAALKVDAPVSMDFVQGATPREVIHLPIDLDQLLSQYKVVEPTVYHDNIQEYWRGNSDEQKLHSLVKSDFTTALTRLPEISHGDPSGHVIDALLKMIIGGPEASYEEAAVARVLKPYDRKICEEAVRSLVDRGIFSRAAGQQRSKHQHYGFNATWLNNSAGPYPEVVHLDAENLEDGLAEQKEVEWPIVGKDGELAALMALVSEGVADMKVDVRTCTVLKREVDDHATRTMTDAETEATLTVMSTGRPLSPLIADTPLHIDERSSNVVTLVHLVRNAGYEGLTKDEIKIAMPSISPDELADISHAAELTWVGYDTARLVHKDHMSKWLVTLYPWATPDEPVSVAPRKWTDIWGNIMEADWQRAVRLAVGHILSRPGITEQTLRHTLGSFLDRLETNAVLAHLVSNRIARRLAINTKQNPFISPVEQTDIAEEEFIYWTMNSDTLWRRGQDIEE